MTTHASATRNESGFSLIEVVVAVTLLALVMIGVATTLVSGLSGAQRTKRYHQATQLANEVVENTRDVSYGSLALQTTDIADDPRITVGEFDPDGSGPLVAEPVVSVASGAAVNPHVTTMSVSGETYDVRKYVTWVDQDDQGGAGQDYKRVTVELTWMVGGHTSSYTASTFVDEVRRGLPTPKFMLSPESHTITVTQGQEAVVPFTVHNDGIVDAYDLQMSTPGARPWTVAFYRDANGDELRDAGDPLLSDTNGSGVVDSGIVATGAAVDLLAVWNVASWEGDGAESMVLTARSGADSTVTHTSDVNVTVGTPASDTVLWLHSSPSPPNGHVTSTKPLDMNATVPTGTTLFQYSTDYHPSDSGRFVDKSAASATSNDNRFFVNWVWQVPETTTYSGTATATLWVAPMGFDCTKTPTVKAYLRNKPTSGVHTGTLMGTATATGAPCSWTQITLTFTVDATVNQNRWIELKVFTQESANEGALFAYDTTTYNAGLVLP